MRLDHTRPTPRRRVLQVVEDLLLHPHPCQSQSNDNLAPAPAAPLALPTNPGDVPGRGCSSTEVLSSSAWCRQAEGHVLAHEAREVLDQLGRHQKALRAAYLGIDAALRKLIPLLPSADSQLPTVLEAASRLEGLVVELVDVALEANDQVISGQNTTALAAKRPTRRRTSGKHQQAP